MSWSNTPKRAPKTSWFASRSRITVRSSAAMHLLPTVWFRNTWSWGRRVHSLVRCCAQRATPSSSNTTPYGSRWLDSTAIRNCSSLKTRPTSSGSTASRIQLAYVKDGINDYVVHGRRECGESRADRHQGRGALYLSTSPRRVADRAAAHVSPRRCWTRRREPFEQIFAERIQRGRRILRDVIPADLPDDARNVMRQAFAGMLWSKQFYHYVVRDWLKGDPGHPPPPAERLERPQSRMVAPLQRRRHLDAGQMGVPVVRGLGSGVPLRAAGAGRFGVRQRATRADAARVVHAPQRATSGV